MALLIDSHAHLDFPQFDADSGAVLKRAKKAGLGLIINIGTSEAASQKVVQISKKDPILWATVGVHPHYAARVSPHWLELLRKLAIDPGVVAVGETGLDFYRNIAPPAVQEALFRDQVHLARELDKPLIIHSRSAHAETLRLLRSEKLPSPPGVMHCFSGDTEWARAFLGLGFYLSFAGPLTYPNARQLREVLKLVPPDRLLLETDAPYLSPQPYRALRNEPAYIAATYERAALVLNMDLEELAAQIIANITSLFPTIKV